MRHTAHVAHHSRGRLRIRVPGAKGKPQVLDAIRKSIACVSGVSKVEVNETIGSLTIHYDPRQQPDFASHLSSETCPQDTVTMVPPPKLQDMAEIDDLIEHEALFLAQHSHSAKVIIDLANDIDTGIKRLTRNAIDLKVLVPAALAAAAFMELGITSSTPIWVTLGIFSFNHFLGMHAQQESKNPPRQSHGSDGNAVPQPHERHLP